MKMRHSWRLFLSRNCSRSSLRSSCYSSPHRIQVHSSSSCHSTLRSLSSLHSFSAKASQFAYPNKIFVNSKNPIVYSFSSEPLVEPKQETDNCSLLSDIFTKFTDIDEINKELKLNSIVISHDIVLKVLKSLEPSPVVARRFFNWVLEKDNERLSSKAYNLMLGILGVNGSIEEFRDLVETMKKKGYGVSKGTRDKVVQKFEEDGLNEDLEKLKGVFASGSIDNSIEKIGLRMSRIVRNQVWGDDVERQIKDLNAEFSSDLVKIVLENLSMEPMKALIFFRWIEESGLYKHNGRTYNAMARVLGREYCIDKFWKVVDEIKSNGFELEVETYAIVFERFVKRKMIREAVDLYEFAMGGANKPSLHCSTFLLKKIVVNKELDMDLFSRVVRIFVGTDNALTDSTLDTLLKSLTSVGRFGECNKVLKAMKEGGFVASGNVLRKIVSRLSSAGKMDEVSKLVDTVEESGDNLDYKAWASLIHGHCATGDLEKASDCFENLVDKGGVSSTGYAFESLINAYCRKNRAIDASKLLQDYVSRNQIKPWHSTYKSLINKLLSQGGFAEALNLLDLMRGHGFPPFLDPFIKHVSRQGTGDDAVAFMRAMTTKKFPSTSVVIRLFEAFFKVGRYSAAQDFLSKCPRYIRNHTDVLNLFYTMKDGEDPEYLDTAATLAV